MSRVGESGPNGEHGPLRFSAVIECSQCLGEFEGVWEDAEALSTEDVTDPPVQDQTCPDGHVNPGVEYPGWMFAGEA